VRIDLSRHTPVEAIERKGCSVVLRRMEGPEARELFFNCQPGTDVAGASRQAEAAYQAVLSVLEDEGCTYGSVVSETLFLRNLRQDLTPVREARERALAGAAASFHKPATTEVEQPPINPDASLEIAIQAIIPNRSPLQTDKLNATADCACAECSRMQGLRVRVGTDARLYAGGIYGRGDDAYEQTHAMFEIAEALLRQAGMAFRDVVRTWIYLPEMERDYAGFNRARREFFEAHGVDPIPASTGIGAGLYPSQHDLQLGLYAVRAVHATVRTVMTTPTLNEAPEYGSDFSRGMRVEESNRVSLHVSGTASIDETGSTAHVGDFDAQVDRMLMNVATLLEHQGAGFDDIVSAVTYLKRPDDEQRLRQKLREAGYHGFPNVMVVAPVCRPELLCETEALAVLPQTARTPA
jgi:enamine deaminase RidA (YjgF/YER057c/UK114 family)